MHAHFASNTIQNLCLFISHSLHSRLYLDCNESLRFSHNAPVVPATIPGHWHGYYPTTFALSIPRSPCLSYFYYTIKLQLFISSPISFRNSLKKHSTLQLYACSQGAPDSQSYTSLLRHLTVPYSSTTAPSFIAKLFKVSLILLLFPTPHRHVRYNHFLIVDRPIKDSILHPHVHQHS